MTREVEKWECLDWSSFCVIPVPMFFAQGLFALINPRVPPEALPRFLWDHLQLDVELLASSLGRSIDDTVLCIHMVLVQMTAHLSNRKF